jgi:antitoxin (DNA-binding transcriptional repressor) of toxin-antitoxin stability system
MKKVQTIAISQFKAQLLGLMEGILKTREEILIKKRGKPIAKVIPLNNEPQKPIPGKLAGTVIKEVDIVQPLGAQMWKVTQ